MKFSYSLLSIFSLSAGVEAFSGPTQNSRPEVSRRESLAKVASIVGGVAGLTTSLPNNVNAYPSEETSRIVTRMGGLLVSN